MYFGILRHEDIKSRICDKNRDEKSFSELSYFGKPTTCDKNRELYSKRKKKDSDSYHILENVKEIFKVSLFWNTYRYKTYDL